MNSVGTERRHRYRLPYLGLSLSVDRALPQWKAKDSWKQFDKVSQVKKQLKDSNGARTQDRSQQQNKACPYQNFRPLPHRDASHALPAFFPRNYTVSSHAALKDVVQLPSQLPLLTPTSRANFAQLPTHLNISSLLMPRELLRSRTRLPLYK